MPMKKLHQDDRRRLNWLRWICLAEFILANVGAIALVLGAIMYPSVLEALRFVGVGLILPAWVGGIALLMFHTKVSGRPWASALAEAGTWSVFPLPAVAMRYLVYTPLPL